MTQLKLEDELRQKLNKACNKFEQRSYSSLWGKIELVDSDDYSVDLHFERLSQCDVEVLISIVENLPSLG